jgi:hypothetical protein
MMIRFSPPSEFAQPAGRGASAARSVAASSLPVSTGDAAAGRSIKRLINASTRLLMSARSALESGKVAQALRHILAPLAGALLVSAACGAFIFSVFIFGCARC